MTSSSWRRAPSCPPLRHSRAASGRRCRSVVPVTTGGGGATATGNSSTFTIGAGASRARPLAGHRRLSRHDHPTRQTGTSGRAGGSAGSGSPVGATAGIMGVRSKSTEKSFRLYNGSDTTRTGCSWEPRRQTGQALQRAVQRPAAVRGRGQAPGAGGGRGGTGTLAGRHPVAVASRIHGRGRQGPPLF